MKSGADQQDHIQIIRFKKQKRVEKAYYDRPLLR